MTSISGKAAATIAAATSRFEINLCGTARDAASGKSAWVMTVGKVQNGRTMTKTMMIAAIIPGISLIIRTALPDSGRSPRASFLP
jgi:hypothetical protein